MQKIDFVNSQQPAINDTNLNLMQTYIETAIQGAVAGDTLPVGAIMPFGGGTVPDNYLLCDGQAVSRTTYSQLFSVIGTSFGVGDGSTTFNVPNMKGKVPVGYDSTQTEFNSLGKTGGEKTHTLTISEMPSHNHTVPYVSDISPTGGGTDPAYGVVHRTNTQNSGSKGGGQAHNNLQPYIVQKYIIKAFQSSGTVAEIVNAHSVSTTNAYSASYVNGALDYSTTEQRIGTWIDGKPIYRKVVNTGTLPNTQSKTVAHNIENFKRIIRIYGNAYDPIAGAIYPLPITNSEGVQYQVALRVSTTNITIATGIDRSNFTESYVVLEYTKTTD